MPILKFSKKEFEAIYDIINKDISPSELADGLKIKRGAIQARLTRAKQKVGFKTSYKFFYELGMRDAIAGKCLLPPVK